MNHNKPIAIADNIYFMQSSNYGRSFSSPERVTESEASDASPYLPSRCHVLGHLRDIQVKYGLMIFRQDVVLVMVTMASSAA